MKKTILLALMLVFGFVTLNAQTQEPKEKTVIIKLNKYCCKSLNETIERTLAYEKGVKDFEIIPEEKAVKVVYKTKSTNQEKIAKSLAKEGVEADGFEADRKAIEKLPNCCKNTAKGLGSGCGD
ncbi:MAG: MerP [Bacteroidetes bacterium]|nr:MerP [Bacteroidota bacterium]